MNRRQFLQGMGIGGIVLAAPRVVLAGEDKPKYTHVDKMYPWDRVARTQDEICSLPSEKNQVWDVESAKWKEIFLKDERLRKLFKDPKKMENILLQLADSNLNNDELSKVYVTKFGIEYRILTPDSSFALRKSQSKKDLEKYGNILYYMTFIKTSEDKTGLIRELIK
jgi:hypothetical protein